MSVHQISNPRNKNSRTFLLSLAGLTLCSTALSGCWWDRLWSITPSLEIRLGKPIFVVNPQNVSRIELQNQTPNQAPWKAVIQKIPANQWPKSFGPPTGEPTDQSRWQLSECPSLCLDNWVSGEWVLHFIDTLNTLTVDAQAPKSEASQLGLEPAWNMARWTTQTQVADSPFWQGLWVGSPGQTGAHTGRWVAFESPSKTGWLSQGAALKMFDYIRNWNVLRNQNWWMGNWDDYDQLKWKISNEKREINSGSLERAGSGWTLPAALIPSMDSLSHQRIQQFLDSPELQTELSSTPVEQKMDWTASGRLERSETLTLHSITWTSALEAASTHLELQTRPKVGQRLWIVRTSIRAHWALPYPELANALNALAKSSQSKSGK